MEGPGDPKNRFTTQSCCDRVKGNWNLGQNPTTIDPCSRSANKRFDKTWIQAAPFKQQLVSEFKIEISKFFFSLSLFHFSGEPGMSPHNSDCPTSGSSPEMLEQSQEQRRSNSESSLITPASSQASLASSNDTNEEDQSNFFEGVEKLLEVWFTSKEGEAKGDLRRIPR